MDKIVKISGGLGNQLFQYAFGQYLKKKFNYGILYDFQTEQNLSFFTNRKPLINDLIFNIKTINYTIYSNVSLYRIKRKLIKEFFPNLSTLFVENIKQQVNLTENILLKKKYFDGYWHSLTFINFVEKELRKEIHFSGNIINHCKNDIKIINETISCSVHVRRGDYLTVENSKIFHICNLNYYTNCFNYLRNLNSNVIFYIFSDDVNWAKENFIGSDFIFLENEQNNPIVDLYLMSNCRFNIISNSTFGWWGAWINKNTDKIVLSPNNWFKNEYQNKRTVENLIPNDWVLINN